MNINEFMQQKNYKKLEHNQPYTVTFTGARAKETRFGFMLAFDFDFGAGRIESHNAHFSTRAIKTVGPDGTATESEQVNDQITSFIRRLLEQTPASVQDNLSGKTNSEIIEALTGAPFTIYPVFSTYETNGQTRHQRDFWFAPKEDQQADSDEVVDF